MDGGHQMSHQAGGGFRSHPRHPASHPRRPSPPAVVSRTQEQQDEALARLCHDTGYINELQPGVRRLLRPPSVNDGGLEMAPVQQRGCELFLGRLPKDLLEDELFRLCEPHGEILEIRMMLDGEGGGLVNRGFAFVVYRRPEEARLAMKGLDRWEIRPGQRIGVRKSVDNCRLFMGGLPRDKTKEEFEAEIRSNPVCGQTMRRVIMYPAVQDRRKNRGFAFVEFSSHREAAIARRQLMRDRVQLWGKEICVDWAQPEGEVEPDVMSQVRILYVRNLNPEITEDTLRDLFVSALPEGHVIEKVKRLKDFAFVHYHDRQDAQTTMDTFNGRLVDGTQIEVTWAKPASTKLRVQQQQQEVQRRSQQDPFWQQRSSLPFPAPLALQQHHQGPGFPYQINSGWRQPLPGFRGAMVPQRHFRNAAGTRTRFSRPNGGQYQEQFSPYHPGAFIPSQTVMYQQHQRGYSTPPVQYNPSQTIHYTHHPLPHYQNQNYNHGVSHLHEQMSHLSLQETVSNATDVTTISDSDFPALDGQQRGPQ